MITVAHKFEGLSMTSVEVVDKTEVETTYPNGVSLDEKRRAFVLENISANEASGEVLLKFLNQVAKWLETGQMPGCGEVRPLKEVGK